MRKPKKQPRRRVPRVSHYLPLRTLDGSAMLRAVWSLCRLLHVCFQISQSFAVSSGFTLFLISTSLPRSSIAACDRTTPR